jgi:hypothetical protein
MIDFLRMLESGAGWEDEGAGDMGRDPGIGVDVPVGWDDACFFLSFFREDSLPLDSERLGEPDRLRLFDFFRGSECLGRPEGVLVPFDDAPEGSLEVSILAFALASSSFRLSIAFCFSSSEVSSSLCLQLAV